MKTTRRQFVLAGSLGIVLGSTAFAKEKKKDDDEVPPTEDLMREHGVLRRILLVYGEVIRRIEAKQEVKPEWVSSSATIIREFIEDYHERDEEEYVFPRLQKAGKLTDLVAVLLAQHQAGRRVTANVLRLATPAGLKSDASRQQLADGLRSFIRMYEAHSAREDTVLFPTFRALLNERELEKLTDVFEDKEKALPHGGFEKMVDEVAKIEQSIGIYDLAKLAGMSERLLELAALFLRLGCTAFGGPAAHIAMMEDEVVARRQWLTRDEFVDLLGATNLIPGPNSTEMAIHIGHRRAGWAGLIVAGVCFIVPAVLLVSLLAWVYVRFGSLPRSTAILDGIKPVVLAIVAQALWRLGRSVLKTWLLGVVALGAVAASFLGVNELVILALGGLMVAAVRVRTAPPAAMLLPLGGVAATSTATAVGLLPLFAVFLKIGSVLFGSGYVLLAFLRSNLVERHHWLTNAQLLDAVAVGQVTPGPVFTTATFVGWLLRGPMGAAVATVGIFLPAFVFVAVSGPLVPRIRRSPIAGAVLDGVNVASLALMAVVTWQLGRTALVNGWTVALAAGSLAVLLLTRLNSVWLIAAGAVVGFLAR